VAQSQRLQAQQKDYVDALMAPIRHALEGAMGALRGALNSAPGVLMLEDS
jgi:hypothetical protein